MAQDPFKYFRVEAHELVDQLGKGVLELEREGPGVLPKLLRLAHTLKGAARVVRRPDIAEYAHAIEGALQPYRESAEGMPREAIDAVLELIDRIAGGLASLGQAEPQAAPEAGPAAAVATPALPGAEPARSVWAEVGELDLLLEGVTETHAQLGSFRRAGETIGRARALAEQLVDQMALKRDRARNDKTAGIADELRSIVRGLDRSLAAAHERIGRELQQVRDSAEQLRLVPAGALFAFLERAARDAAHAVGKLVKFESRGGEVRLDSAVLRVMHEVLLHIVRNAVAHGIESETDRRIAGKPQSGRVSVEVLRRGRRIVFRCSDDGRGIDVEAVRRAALRKGTQAAADMTQPRLIELLLAGGISTSVNLTEVAGRGVGMDVVRAAMARLRGTITAESTPGKGTTFELTVPLTLAATEALLMEAGGTIVAVPFDAVRHVVHSSGQEIYKTARGHEMVHDGHAMPYVALAQLLDPQVRAVGANSAVIISAGSKTAAIGVERLRGTANLVFRSLPELTPALPLLAGASLDADGNPQLVLDPDNLVAEAERYAHGIGEQPAPPAPILVIDDSLTTRMLEQSILESAGFEVDLATSAEEGLEIARRKRYSLFLVDVEMPGMDGFSFIERIRADHELNGIPAILVTSRNEPEDLKRGRDVGAQDYVVKSEFNQALLLQRIRELVTAS